MTNVVNTIAPGFLLSLLLASGCGAASSQGYQQDGDEALAWMAEKVAGLRIFADDAGKMNRSIQEINGDIIVVSQFTLFANIKKGNRPSYIKAASPEIAIPIYRQFVQNLEIELGKTIQTGEFGAMMDVALINDGPVTIIIDSKNRE